LSQLELATPAVRNRRRRASGPSERVTAARVTVAWTPSNHDDSSHLTSTEVELEAAANRTWTCPESFGSNWLEAISSAHCNEVVLTARVGSDSSAKHLVLDLAELLTFRLAASQPLIRVLFVATAPTPRKA
jgi:hypothetical protein